MGNPTQPAFPGQDLSVTGWGPYAQMQGGWDGTFAAGLMGMFFSNQHLPLKKIFANLERVSNDESDCYGTVRIWGE
jgi:hypothetical protein